MHGESEYDFMVGSQYILHNTKASKTKRINIYLEKLRQTAKEHKELHVVASESSNMGYVKGAEDKPFNIILFLLLCMHITLVKTKKKKINLKIGLSLCNLQLSRTSL